MSGGEFGYKQYALLNLAEYIHNLKEIDRYSTKTQSEFIVAQAILKIAYAYVHRIDWLVSGDDGEDNFHKRLAEDLDALNEEEDL